jgi:chromosome segregation ATPase
MADELTRIRDRLRDERRQRDEAVIELNKAKARIAELERAFAQVQEAKIVTEKRWLKAKARIAELERG